MKKYSLNFAVLAAVLGCWCSSTQAATYLVTEQAPSIQAAITSASNGDTIIVDPGRYYGSLNFQGKSLFLESSGGAGVTTIAGTGGTTVTIGGAAAIKGFTIIGGTAAFGAGMSVSGQGTLIANNVFKGNFQGSGGYGAAIGGNNASPIINGNIFTGNSADGQYLSGVVSFINASSPTITNNVFYNNSTRAINFTVPSEAMPIVANNTIVNNSAGLYIDGRIGASPMVFANNLIYGNDIGIESPFSGGIVPAWLQNNLIGGNDVNIRGLPNVIGSNGNFSGDPMFLDAANADFHLLAGSAALGNGTPRYAPVTDYDGVIRSVTAPSVGAFEVAAVPEASTVALFILGLLAIGAVCRRQKSKTLA